MRTAILALLALAATTGQASAQGGASAGASGGLPPAAIPASVPVVDSNVARQGHFYIGGRYVGDGGRAVMVGQMYVEVWAPRQVRHPYPIVFLHGAGSSATTWMQTADGRRGWAHHLVDMGYIVYLTDAPAQGRSPYHAAHQGPQNAANVGGMERLNTATVTLGDWPQAKLHTQYPGEGPDRGRRGNPAFDAAFARNMPNLASTPELHALVRDAGTALLDRIGPAILVTHSRAGPTGWILADARPALVKGIIAIEPSGPPFEGQVNASGPSRPWGVADLPLTYDPPAREASELRTERQAQPERPGLVPCVLQAAPARQLPNLRGIPILIVTGEASYHAPYDHCTARYLTQAGVANEHMRLEERGIRGNGHGIPTELNNDVTIRLIDAWLTGKGL